MSNPQSALSRALIPLLALTAALLAASTASAASPEELTERCIDSIQQTTRHTIDAIGDAADRGVAKIEALDANDKPVPLLQRAAAKSNTRIEKLEIRGDRDINKTADRCIRLLARGEPNPALIAAINDARARAIVMIHDASIEAHQTVRATLETALEDEEVDDGAGVDTD